VVDYKTTAQLTREHGLQLAAYALLCRKHGLRVNRRLAVRIKKNRPGEFYVRQFEDHQEDVEAFLGLLEFWLWRHREAVRRAS
jgi:predicted RecB family nuclease